MRRTTRYLSNEADVPVRELRSAMATSLENIVSFADDAPEGQEPELVMLWTQPPGVCEGKRRTAWTRPYAC